MPTCVSITIFFTSCILSAPTHSKAAPKSDYHWNVTAEWRFHRLSAGKRKKGLGIVLLAAFADLLASHKISRQADHNQCQNVILWHVVGTRVDGPLQTTGTHFTIYDLCSFVFLFQGSTSDQWCHLAALTLTRKSKHSGKSTLFWFDDYYFIYILWLMNSLIYLTVRSFFKILSSFSAIWWRSSVRAWKLDIWQDINILNFICSNYSNYNYSNYIILN